MFESLEAGEIVDIESLPTISDATAGGIEPGSITFDLCREFVDDFPSRDDLTTHWEGGWEGLFSTLNALTEDDLTKTVRIRGKPHTVIEAIHRELDHYGYHVGQIVLVARVLAKDNWTTLTIPRGGSAEYNRRVWQS